MTHTANRIFVSIAVSSPGGGLEKLPGAINAAKRMDAWAAAQRYATVLIHDQDHAAVTVDLLNDRISAAINQVTERAVLERLVVYFAGHGAALAIGDQYWILSNWHKRTSEAIRVSSLQRMLEYYGPRQVAIIGDACQEFSARFMDLNGSAVLDRPDPPEDPQRFEIDHFFAVDAGKQAFMIKGVDGNEDFCVFTEVLLDALQGDTARASYEHSGSDKVITSQSLARYLAENVGREAGRYGVRMSPHLVPGFYTDRTYLKMPDIVGRDPSGDIADIVIDELTLGSIGVVGAVGAMRDRGGRARKKVAASKRAPKRKRHEARSVARVELARPKGVVKMLAAGDDAIQARESVRAAFVDEVGGATVRDHFETGCGICVSGARVATVQATRGRVSAVEDAPDWFRLNLGPSHDSLRWTDALVTLQSGRTISACVVQGFIVALHVVDDVPISLFHRQIGASEFESHLFISLLAKLHAGLLSEEAIIGSATDLRYGKHRTLTLGCIAAQFYDAIRDVDSLRSMASFYAMNRQPVPLDIVLYGGGTIRESRGRLYADIPAVALRVPRTEEERRRGFTFEPTPAFKRHPIAGRIPWMRQAWGALATATCDNSAEAWRKQAMAAMDDLAPGTFTSVHAEGRQVLAELARIRTRRQR